MGLLEWEAVAVVSEVGGWGSVKIAPQQLSSDLAGIVGDHLIFADVATPTT